MLPEQFPAESVDYRDRRGSTTALTTGPTGIFRWRRTEIQDQLLESADEVGYGSWKQWEEVCGVRDGYDVIGVDVWTRVKDFTRTW